MEELKVYSNVTQYIKITMGAETFGIDIGFVDNILRMQRITRVPNVAAYIKGVINIKYTLYENIHNELKKLKEKYKLILLTDNWPCVIDYLKEYNLYDFFDNIYISSMYGVEKKDKILFDYPINELNIKQGEALFIDDNESNLDIAKEKNFDVMLMDRENKINDSKYKIINNLNNI